MKVSEAIKQIRSKACNDKCTEIRCDDSCMHGKDKCAFEMAIKSLEMQEKLKQWIENYKNPEFKDVMITRDGLIDILEEFRLECETDARNTV